MATILQLMVLEDDDDQYQTYSDTADDLNDEQVIYNLTRMKSAPEARDALLSSNFDCAIIDLNLDTSNPQEASGNGVLSEILKSHRFPVFVVSGNLGHLLPSIQGSVSTFLKLYDREKPNDEIFSEMKKIYLTGITDILGGRGDIEKKLGEIFWNHLANDLDVWTEKDNLHESALLRYTVSHLSEYLDTPSDQSGYYHEAEFYIKPPIREHIASGDIVQKGDMRYIVLSPACDISVRGIDDKEKPLINAKRITLAKLIKIQRQDFVDHGIIKETTNSSSRESALSKIITGQSDKHVFLPGYKMLHPSVADLQNLYSIDFDEYQSDYERIATVSSPFLKDIQAKFSAYYGRQGQPELNKGELIKEYKKELSPPVK